METENHASQVYESLLFLRVFKTFRIAIQPGKMIIALLALAVIGLAGFLMDYSKTVVVTHNANGGVVDTELDYYILQQADAYELYIKAQADPQEGVFSTLWHFARKRFHNSLKSLFDFNFSKIVSNVAECVKACDWAFRYHPIYCIIFSLIKLGVISIAGGAICRIAALQFAQGEKPGTIEALHFSTKRFLSFFTAPLIPLVIIGIVGGFVMLLGLIGNIPWAGEILMGIFALFAFIAGAIVAVLLIGTVAGFNLMFPAVAYDGSDCFDAMSRSLSYVYSRPWRMAFYSSIAAVYGAICYLFVRFFAFLLLTATYVSLDIGIYKEIEGISKLERIWARPAFLNLLGPDQVVALSRPQDIAGWIIYLLVLLVIGLVVAFIVSFYFSANTIIYALLRNRVDDTAIEDVYTQFEQAEVDTSVDDADKADEPQATEDEESAE